MSIVIIELILVAIIIALAILGKGRYGYLSFQLVFVMLIGLVIMEIGGYGNVNTYTDGIEHSNVIEVVQGKNDNYHVTLDNGKRYVLTEAIYGEETKVVTNCKLITHSILGFDTYKTGDLLVVKPANFDTMSASEKEYYLSN